MEMKKSYLFGSFFLFAIIVAVFLISISLKRLTSIELGLEYDRVAKILDDAAKNGGLHTGPPGFEFIKFPKPFILAELPDGTCVSQDGLRVDFVVSFQYQMPKEWLAGAVLRYRDFNGWQRIVQAAGISAVQHSCSLFTVPNFQNQRGVIQRTMLDNLRLKLEGPEDILDGSGGVFARAISVQLQTVLVPSEYKDAIAKRQSAEEDINLAINQRNQEVTKANTELLTANEEARKISDTAQNEAEVILTEATLKAEETTFIFAREAEVLLSVKEALSLTSEGIVAYMSNKLYETAPSIKVSMMEPSKSSRGDEL